MPLLCAHTTMSYEVINDRHFLLCSFHSFICIHITVKLVTNGSVLSSMLVASCVSALNSMYVSFPQPESSWVII